MVNLQVSTVEITESPDTKQWSEFVLNHPHGNIFQTPEMAEVYKIKKEETKMSVSKKLKGKIIGLIYDDVEEEEKCWQSMLEWNKEHQTGKSK